MNNDMRSYVINLLETYQERTRKIALLHYELEHPARTSEAAHQVPNYRGDRLR